MATAAQAPACLSWSCGRPGVEYSSLDDFTSLTEIYRSRASVVWRGRCRQTGEEVAIKGHPKAESNGAHQREVSSLEWCNGEGLGGVTRLLGSFTTAHTVCIVVEYCPGGDLLHQMAKHGGVMSEGDVRQKVVRPLLQTLCSLHEGGIVHRDIKAENVFFTEDGSLKLGDFGSAINLNREVPLTRVGTLDYMAPEVIEAPSQEELDMDNSMTGNSGLYNEKVDVWSLGILTFELITGAPPFEVDDEEETIDHILWSPVDFPHDMSPSCRDFIAQALQKEAADRPSAKELLRHPWISQNMATGILAAPSIAPPTKQESLDQARDFTSPPRYHQSTGKVEIQKSPVLAGVLAGSSGHPCSPPKMAMPSLVGIQAALKLLNDTPGSGHKCPSWSCANEPSRLDTVEPEASLEVSMDESGSESISSSWLCTSGPAVSSKSLNDTCESECNLPSCSSTDDPTKLHKKEQAVCLSDTFGSELKFSPWSCTTEPAKLHKEEPSESFELFRRNSGSELRSSSWSSTKGSDESGGLPVESAKLTRDTCASWSSMNGITKNHRVELVMSMKPFNDACGSEFKLSAWSSTNGGAKLHKMEPEASFKTLNDICGLEFKLLSWSNTNEPAKLHEVGPLVTSEDNSGSELISSSWSSANGPDKPDRLEPAESLKLLGDACTSEFVLPSWSCASGPDKVKRDESSNQDSKQPGCFNCCPRKLARKGLAWMKSIWLAKEKPVFREPGSGSPHSMHPDCTEKMELLGEGSSCSSKSILGQIKKLLLRSKSEQSPKRRLDTVQAKAPIM